MTINENFSDGGTVFVSSFVAEYYVNAGHEVYVLNRNTKSQVDFIRLGIKGIPVGWGQCMEIGFKKSDFIELEKMGDYYD